MYDRLGIYTRQNVKDMLSSNPIFSQLPDAEQSVHINKGISLISALRNSNGKDTYKFDSVGSATSVVITASTQVREVFSGQTLKAVQDTILDAGASKRYTIFFYPGATIGTGWVADPYIDILWVGSSTVDLDFQDADFTYGIRSLYGLNATGSIFTSCTITLTKAQFLDTIAKWDATTTLWTDGLPIGT